MQEYSVSSITAAIALVAMAIFLFVDFLTLVKKTIWARLFAKAPYILGTILAITVIILEKEKILNFISNPPQWAWIAGSAVLAVLALDGVMVAFLWRREKIRGCQEY